MGETRVGHLYHIEVEDDPNAFPMGILLSKKIQTELLKYLKFPVFIRRRNACKTGKDLSEYASFVHQQLNKLEDIHGVIEEEMEQKTKQPATKTGMEPGRRRTGQRAHVAVSFTNNVICVDLDRFQMLKDYHRFAFQLDRGGTAKKTHLQAVGSHGQDDEKALDADA